MTPRSCLWDKRVTSSRRPEEPPGGDVSLRCPSCGHPNRADRRYCAACGSHLGQACPSCGTRNNPEEKFCGNCGTSLTDAPPSASPARSPGSPLTYTPRHLVEKILRDRTKLEGERRTVTVLFADAAGFTPLSAHLDPEEVYGLIKECVARMMEAVHRYDGIVAHFLGDGIMALFGAPIAHEDSARRAVAAALAMQHALEAHAAEILQDRSIQCRFRVGLNTGPVVVGTISDNLDMDFTAIGDTTNLAARMQQLAEPGSVFLSENTYRGVREYFECQPLGALTVKGRTDRVPAYKAVRATTVRTRFEAAVGRGLTPFVGRARELSALRGCFAEARRGRGHVVFVAGEAGIGKSRLLLEFRHGLRDEGARWLEGHCSAYGTPLAYLPLVDVIKHAFDVEEGDSEASILRKVDAGTAAWEEPARVTVPYLRYLLSVDPGDPAITRMDPRERRAGIFDALRALVLQESRGRPLVVAIEDLHWIDEQSAEALAVVVDVIVPLPVLLVLTARPGYAHTLGDRTYYSRLALSHLPPEEGVALAQGVLQIAALPEDLKQLITRRAEGNPFFIEEVTKSLVETGVLHQANGGYTLARPIEDICVPDTIQEVILARIDRLGTPAKEAIQLASVLGREFTTRLLNRMSDREATLDEVLGELKALELIYEKAYFPELAYMFKHALTHEVAYSTILLERRKVLHRLAAAAIEELYADRRREQYETLAHHYVQGEAWPKALDYLVKAGDKAAAAYANREALDFYLRALQTCAKLGESTLATVAFVAGKRGGVSLGIGRLASAAADFERMLEAARKLGDRRLEGRALCYLGNTQIWSHDLERAEETLRTALAVAEGFDDVRLAASSLLLWIFVTLGRHAEAAALLRAAEELAPRVDDSVVAGGPLPNLAGLMRSWTGRFDAALEVHERWRAVVETSGQIMGGLANQWAEALARGGKGQYEQALRLLTSVLATCDRVGEVFIAGRALNSVGWIYGELEHHARAMDWNQRAVDAARAMNVPDPEIENNARLNLADNLLALGRLAEAEEQFQRVEQVVRDPRPQDRYALWRYAQHLFHSYGELWLAKGDHHQALAYADECLALAEESDSKKNVVKGRRLRAQALLAQGKLQDAEKDLATALQIARRIGNPPQLWKTCTALGDLRGAQGSREEARRAYRDALSVVEDMAAGLTDEDLRESFLTSDRVQSLRRAAEAPDPT